MPFHFSNKRYTKVAVFNACRLKYHIAMLSNMTFAARPNRIVFSILL